ncbi:MAG: monooxygenase [Alphaproteobacteria bacterium]|nr:monooxygenase [Alphaproteobacteria bacterium]
MKFVVAGAGIGGLCSALALSRCGVDVDVIERSPQISEVGAGLQLSPNAMKVIRALGVEDAVAAKSCRPDALELRLGKSGRTVFSIPMGDEAVRRYGAAYLHVHRADVIDALRAAVEDAGVRIRLGTEVASYAQDGDTVSIGLDTGEVVVADGLVGADGLKSAVRKRMFGPEAPLFTGAVAWRILSPANVAPDLPNGAVVWAGRRQHAVTYRIRNGALINFVGVVEDPSWRIESWHEPGDPEALMKRFAGWTDPLRRVIAAAEVCNRWALFDRNPLPEWSRGRVTLLGDACHPMPPFQAQGAAMAIEDAFVLSRCLVADAGNPVAALRRYETIRRPRTTRMLQSARDNMDVFHRSNALTQLATYGPMRLANSLAPAFVRSRQDWIYSHDVAQEPL